MFSLQLIQMFWICFVKIKVERFGGERTYLTLDIIISPFRWLLIKEQRPGTSMILNSETATRNLIMIFACDENVQIFLFPPLWTILSR